MFFLFQVAALFHIGHTKSHPPIPEHLSVEAKDFLLKCLQKYVAASNSFLYVLGFVFVIFLILSPFSPVLLIKC